MRTIIAGSRDIVDDSLIQAAITASGFEISCVISGGAKGVDTMAEQWARAQGISVAVVLPDWKTYGRGAGPERNRRMAGQADALIAIWDGKSRGTRSMIQIAQKANLKVHVFDPVLRSGA